MSEFYGGSESNLRLAFKAAEEVILSIIFIADLDAIISEHAKAHNPLGRRILSQLLILMDGLTTFKCHRYGPSGCGKLKKK